MALTQISTAGVKDDAVTAGKIPANAVGSSEIAANAVGSSELADNAVDTAAIADDAVTAAKIASQTITGSEIANDAITSALIADNTIQATNIAAGAIGGNQIASNTIGTTNLADDAVSTVKIQDQAVTLAKLPHGTGSNNGKFLRANNGADPTFETVNTDLVADTSPQLGGDLASNGNDILMGDNDEIKLGVGGDLKLEHQSSSGDSLITEVGGGNLIIQGSNIIVRDAGTAEKHIEMTQNGSVDLYHNNSKKFETHDVGTIFTQGTSGGTNGAIKVNTTMDTFGSIIVRDQTHSSQNIAALQVENNGTGTDETNLVLRSVSLNSAAWANAWYGAKSHKFGIQTGADGTQTVEIDSDGLKFNGDSAAANALDDYEEGTWVPQFRTSSGGSATPLLTFSSRRGRYVKVGKLVYVSCIMNWSTKHTNGSGLLLVENLPFTINSNECGSGGAPSFNNVDVPSASSIASFATEHANGTTYFYAGLVSKDNAGWQNIDYSAINNAGNYRVQFCYEAA